MSPFLCNELPVPPKDGVGCDERGDFGESPSPDGFTPNRQSAALVVGQSEPSSPELLLQDTVFFPKVVDDCVLLTRNPTGHRGHEDLPWVEYRRHPRIVARSRTDRQLSA